MERHTSALRHARILLVDDHHQFLVMIKSVLIAAGATALQEVNSVEAARRSLAGGRLDLLIMDEVVGAERGSDLVRALRRDAKNPSSEIPIVMLTGAASPQNVVLIRDAGVDQFVAKPFTARLLLERISEALTHRRRFVRSATYAGPDRRRKTDTDYAGPERRKPMRTIEG